jgi:menaquinone-dependent protoporphyrinogen IX oxidase
MKKTLVIYTSKYGGSKKYAEWITADLQADIFEAKSFDINNFANYEMIIFGCGLYAGQLSLKNLLAKNFEQIKDKKLAFFTVGLENPSDATVKEKILSQFSQEILKKTGVFCFRGAINSDNLSFVHKQGLNMLKFILSKKKPEELSAQEKEILSAFDKKSVDFTDKNAILPLVQFVKN